MQDGGKNRVYWLNAMKRNNLGVATENDLLHYSINVPNASSQVENYIITKAALNDHIISNTPEGTHYLGIKALNGELSELIYTGSVSKTYSSLSNLYSGDYSDTINFILNY